MNRYRIAVHITPRRGLLDPQGKTVADALHTLGFAGVRDVHVGRHIVVEIDAADKTSAEGSTPSGQSSHERARNKSPDANFKPPDAPAIG